MKEMEITKVLNLVKGNKYEAACAAFDLVDHIFKVDVPKSMRTRKLSVQAMSLLHDGVIKFGYENKNDIVENKSNRDNKSEEE
ncbi:MAG: hypothetical protein OEV78_06195 [Spirochaetia bacterium]|nr:hypothetical protein [Spirochaetia bacterium]